MCLSHRSYSYVCKRWKCGRSTLHTSVNIMTNFNVRIIMNNVQIIIKFEQPAFEGVTYFITLEKFNVCTVDIQLQALHL
jgi:uncharacterized protein YchJ